MAIDNARPAAAAAAGDSALWNDVCLASAYFHRAQTLLHDNNNVGTNDNPAGDGAPPVSAVATAEKALELYQSCHARVKKTKKKKSIIKRHSSNAASADIAVAALSTASASGSMSNDGINNNSNNRSFTINLELRMAQTLRFLALVHAARQSSASVNTANDTTDEEKEKLDGSENGNQNHLETAIKYHDMAVSLLVGVFDEEEEEEEEYDEVDIDNDGAQYSGSSKENDESSRNKHHHQQLEGEMDIFSTDSFSDMEESSNGNGNNNNGRVMLSIRVPSNAKLNMHLRNNTNNNNNTPGANINVTATLQAAFLLPTEDERVRAIAVSLNALAELHAGRGDDRAAMDSYREALEILRAATEEEEDVDTIEEESGVDLDGNGSNAMDDSQQQQQQQRGRSVMKKSSSLSSNAAASIAKPSISPVQADLANTLMNVGNFHLRRDELDAALNAYSTVWALHSGNSLDQSAMETNSHVPPSTPSSSLAGSASVSLPYLNTPQPTLSSMTKSISTPNATHSTSSFATPNNNEHNAALNPLASSPGALAALTNLGIVHERLGELNEAVACFEYVHSMRAANCGREHVDTLNTLINIGNCRQRLGEYEHAIKVYGEAARSYRTKVTRFHDMMSREEEKSNTAGGAGIGSSTPSSLDADALDVVVKLHRSLSGALRNWGTCYWKQRRVAEAIDCLNEAVDVIDSIVSLLSASLPSGQENARQDKESMAQILGLLGCLYLEYKLDDPLQLSYDKSEEAFRTAIGIYEDLGWDARTHPSIVWARHNLAIVEQSRQQASSRAPPPPPPPTPSPSARSSATPLSPAATPTTPDDNDVVDFDDIDSVELDEVLQDDEDNSDIDDVFQALEVNSTDELDEFLSQAPSPKKGSNNVNVATMERDEQRGSSYEEEVDFDEEVGYVHVDDAVVQSNPEHTASGGEKISIGVNENRPLSNENRNISASLLSAEEDQEEEYYDDDDEEERVSQLQLQTNASMDEGDLLEAARAHMSLARHFEEKKDSAQASAHYTEAHSIYVVHFGDTSKEVASILKKLGDLNAEDGALDAAKELYMEALEMEEVTLGQCLPSSLNAAGAACLKNDDFRSAMEFHRRALQIQRKSSPTSHGGTQSDKYEMYETLVRIGNVYYSERNNYTHVTSGPAGVDYREFIESGFLGWIANAHDMRGEYIRAVQFYEESLQISMSRKGKEGKRETALTLNRLGSLTRELGRYDEAMDYHQKALNIQRSGSGTAKAMTAETCVLMGMVKSKMAEFKSALNLYEDSLLVLKNSLGEDHSSSWKTMAQIGSVHFELSNYDNAMTILQEAERWQLASAGEENRDTLETQALIGRVLSATGKFDEALEKLRDVCEKQNKLFGSKHPTIADTLSYIGECFLDQGMATEARGQFVDCYNMRKHFFAVDQIQVAESMVHVIRARNGQPERALAIYHNAMQIYKENLPDDHVLIGRLCVYEGDSNAELLNFSQAIEQYEQAKHIFHKSFYGGETAADSALVEVNIGKVLLRKCDYDSAKISFVTALDIYKKILPEGHQKITATLNHLDRVEQEEALCV